MASKEASLACCSVANGESSAAHLDSVFGETSDSIRNSRPASGIHTTNDTTIDMNWAAGDPRRKTRRKMSASSSKAPPQPEGDFSRVPYAVRMTGRRDGWI